MFSCALFYPNRPYIVFFLFKILFQLCSDWKGVSLLLFVVSPHPTGNVGGIFGRPFSFFPSGAEQAGGQAKVEPQILGRRRCWSALRVARGQTIMISNSQTFKAQNSGKTEASFEKKRPQLVFLGTPHGDRQRKHLSQVAPYGRKWRRIKRFLPQAHLGVRSNQDI